MNVHRENPKGRRPIVSTAGMLAVLAASGLAGCAAMPPPDLTHCLEQPTRYDWQALDDNNVIVWAMPGDDVFDVALAHPIEGLARSQSGKLELIDGDEDGYICSSGLDSVALWSEADEADASSRELIDTADVFFVDRLNALALNERLDSSAGTRGARISQ